MATLEDVDVGAGPCLKSTKEYIVAFNVPNICATKIKHTVQEYFNRFALVSVTKHFATITYG